MFNSFDILVSLLFYYVEILFFWGFELWDFLFWLDDIILMFFFFVNDVFVYDFVMNFF